MEIIGSAAHLKFARLDFPVEISEAVVDIAVVRSAFQKFVERVISRLDDRGKHSTPLHELWLSITETGPEAEEYCQLMGSLGLSPYEEHSEIDEILNRASNRLHPGIVRDLCNAADESTFSALAELALGVAESLDLAQEARLGDLLAVGFPADQASYAWQWGRQAADRVRREFHISHADPQGGQRFLA